MTRIASNHIITRLPACKNINEHKKYSNFTSPNCSFKGNNSAFSYAKRTKFVNKLFDKKLFELNLEKLEGIQQGLKTFKGVSLKQIAFALTDLHAINMISGCKNHCLHCYANAQPFIKRYPFEDLLQICSDVKELRNRLGINPAHHRGQSYIDCSFDSDALDCHLFDKNGVKHDFIEIAKIIKEGFGYKPVFDTNGWEAKDTEKQKIAEVYVKKLLQDKNYNNFHQINISINPFRPQYVQAIKSGYSLDSLYQPIRKVGRDFEEEETLLSEDYKKARDRYTKYIKDTANVLLTFKPLLKTKKLDFIIRVFDNSVEEMKGFRIDDFKPTIKHILQELNLWTSFGMLSQQEFDSYSSLLQKVSTRIITSGRIEKFYKVKNPNNFEMISNITPERETAIKDSDLLQKYKKVSATEMGYLKIISADGKVYMYDNYSIFPTDIKLSTSTEEVKTPFRIPVKDFVVTQDMIDRI